MDKKVIGCTGGIGSGKSAIVAAFAALGIPAYDCDRRTKALYDEDAVLCRRVAELLGDGVLTPDGKLDKGVMAARLFADRALLARLESIVHPAVASDFMEWAQRQQSDIVVLESAILLEKPFFDTFAHYTVTVSAPEEVRIARVMHRDGLSREQVAARMAAQWTDAQREAKADITIVTDDTTPVLPVLLKIIEKLKK